MDVPDAVEAARLVLRLRTAEDQAVVYGRLAALGPVHVMPWKAVVVTSHQACRQVLADAAWATLDGGRRDRITPGWRANPSLVGFHSSLITTNPPAHAGLRRTLTAGLSPRAVAGLGAGVAAAVGRCLDEVGAALAADGTADLVPVLSERLPTEILCTWLGLPTGDAPALARLTRRWSLAFELGPSPAQLADADRAHAALQDYLRPHLLRRRSAPGDDTLSRWQLPAPHGGGLDITQALDNTALMFLGAKDLTALTTSAAHTLLSDPSLVARLRQDSTSAVAAAENIARLHPPIAVVTRVASRDMLLGGVTVEAGRIVHALLQPANRDSAHVGAGLAFGAGIHYCPGASLTRLQLRTLLPAVASRFPALRIAAAAPTRGVAFPHRPSLLVTDRPAAHTVICPRRSTSTGVAGAPLPGP